MKKVMSVGQCNPDHFALTHFLKSNFQCDVIRIDSTEEALEKLKVESVDLVLVNRKLDIDYTDGTILIQKMKSADSLKSIPVMLVSNYPEYQEEAVGMGALYGVGKQEYSKPEVLERFQGVLDRVSGVL